MTRFLEDAETVLLTWDSPALALALLAVLWLAGACLASFAGLVASRIGPCYEEGRPVLPALASPPSSCDGCGRRLSPAELVPVLGWLAFRGRCRSCGHAVSPAYPATEALAGAAAAAVPYVAGGLNAEAAGLWAVLSAGILVSWTDVRHHVVPEEATWTLLFAGLLASPFAFDMADRVSGAAACAAAMWLSMAAVGWLKGEDTAAGGDVALAAAAGGWTGLSAAPWFLAAAAGAFAAHSLAARSRGSRWTPMAPALSAALLAACAAAALA